jgi:hypothetical protein
VEIRLLKEHQARKAVVRQMDQNQIRRVESAIRMQDDRTVIEVNVRIQVDPLDPPFISRPLDRSRIFRSQSFPEVPILAKEILTAE